MDDGHIVELFWQRSENAISEADKAYKPYCMYIARHILGSDEDAEECVNDAYMRAWNAIPPHRPARLATFLGKITRNLALDRVDAQNAEKRGGGQLAEVLEEWRECVPGDRGERMADELAIKDAFDRFLRGLPTEPRRIFLRRYWYTASVREIARDFGWGESRVKMQLLRTRRELKEFLEKEGFDL